MTTGFSAAQANGFLNTMRTGGAALAGLTNAYVQLHTGDPGANGTANVSAGSTTRVIVNHTAPTAGAMAMTGTPPSWNNGGVSETITHISVWDATSAGTVKYSGALTTPKAWASGDTLNLNTLGLSQGPVMN